MKTIHITGLLLGLLFISACQKDKHRPDQLEAQNSSLNIQFRNTFKGEEIGFSGPQQPSSTYWSKAGQAHSFSQIKYLISSLRLVREDGKEFAYFTEDLDKGAWLVDQKDSSSRQLKLTELPAGKYKALKFGLGLPRDLNVLDQERFPKFYQKASANDTQMMWEWGVGYRFTKIEGYYGEDNKPMRIHTGSTVKGELGEEQGVDAYREILLEFPHLVELKEETSELTIEADLNCLLSGSETITLSSEQGDELNATPNLHSSLQMLRFLTNMAGQQDGESSGMFSIHL